MSKRAVGVVALVAGAMLVNACDESNDGGDATGPKKDTAAAPGAAGDSTGIAECDAYLAKLDACPAYPKTTIATMRAGYRVGASNPAAKGGIAMACQQSAAVFSCGGAPTPPAQPAGVQGGATPPAAANPIGAPPAGAPVGAPPAANPAAANPGAGLPAGASPLPTLDEWNGITKEVNVKGSTALSCETKMVREWLRVSCRGKNDSGGTPTGVQVTRGAGRGDVYAFRGAGVTSLVLRWVDGQHVEAIFSWTDKSHKFVSQWHHGAPNPPIKGVFEGAKSPLDRPTGAGGKACSDNADCGRMEACCWDSERNIGPACMSSTCLDTMVQACRSQASCPSMYVCRNFSGKMSCTPP